MLPLEDMSPNTLHKHCQGALTLFDGLIGCFSQATHLAPVSSSSTTGQLIESHPYKLSTGTP